MISVIGPSISQGIRRLINPGRITVSDSNSRGGGLILMAADVITSTNY
jgi:hypothetical protein